MGPLKPKFHTLALVCAVTLLPMALRAEAILADPARAERLLADLQRPDNAGWARVERQLLTEWRKTGSGALDVLVKRGQDALAEDDIPAALDHLGALTDHAPNFAEGWNLRATALYRAGRFGMAMADLQRALALNPNHFGALTGVAIILAETGDHARAIQAYEAALAIHPHLERVRQSLDRLRQELAGFDI